MFNYLGSNRCINIKVAGPQGMNGKLGPLGPIGPGNPGQTGPTGPSNVSSQNVFYVAKGGNDTTGSGQSFNPFATIQKAIDSCSTGSATSLFTIFIYPGIYEENLAINNKNINFIGSGNQEFTYNTTIKGINLSPTITLDTSSSSTQIRIIGFQNLQIQNGGTNTSAIKITSNSLTSSGKLTIQNCYITSVVDGISLIDASGDSISTFCNWQIIINLSKIYTDKLCTSALIDIGGKCTYLSNQTIVNYNGLSNSPLIKISGFSSNTIQNSSLLQDNLFCPSLTNGLLYISNSANGTPATNSTVLNNTLFYSINQATMGSTGTSAIVLDAYNAPTIPPPSVYCTNCTFSVRSNNPTGTYAIQGITGIDGSKVTLYYGDSSLYSTIGTAYKIDNTNIDTYPIQNLTI